MPLNKVISVLAVVTGLALTGYLANQKQTSAKHQQKNQTTDQTGSHTNRQDRLDADDDQQQQTDARLRDVILVNTTP